MWTSAELVAAFIADNDIDATPAELNEGRMGELLEELRSCGCIAVCVDPVTLDDDAATVPIQDVLSELLGEEIFTYVRNSEKTTTVR